MAEKQTKIAGPKPMLFDPQESKNPKAIKAEKLAALHIISREESADLEQCKLFVPNQRNLFKP